METLNVTNFNISFLESTEDILPTSSTSNPLADLEIANMRFRNTLIPCIVYAGVLILVGLVGNSLVCYVFGFRLKRCAQNHFILFLAVFDLLSCTTGLPAEIVDMALHFKYDSAVLCKIMRFINGFTAMSSILTLIVVAVDRYRRVRKPLKSQISCHHAKLSLIPIIIIALLFSAPSLYVYGLRTVDSGIPGIKGLDCTISDEAKTTIVPLIYNSFLFLCFLILASSLIIMYSLILRSLKKHAITLRKASVGTLSTGNESLHETCSITDNSTSASRGTDVENPLNPTKADQFCASSESSVQKISTITDGKDGTNDCTDSDEIKVEVTDSDQKITSQSYSILSGNSRTLTSTSCTNLDDVHEAGRQSSDVNVDKIIKDNIMEIDEHVCNSASNNSKDRQTCSIEKQSTTDFTCGSEYLKNTNVNEEPKIKLCLTDVPTSGDTTPHHVSFDVNGTTPEDTEKIKIKRIPRILATIFHRKRRMSETPFLHEQQTQAKGYLNPAFNFKTNEVTRQDKHKNKILEHQKHKKRDKENSKQRNITRKTTIIAFVVTLVFILSFVPHLCLQVAHLIKKGFDEKLEGASLALYNTFLRSYFINNVANPIIYGLLNENFRAEVKLVLVKLRCWKPR